MSTTFDLKPLPGATLTLTYEGGQLYRVTTAVLVDGGRLEHDFPLSVGMLSVDPGDEDAMMPMLKPVALNRGYHIALSLLGRGAQLPVADRTVETRLTCTITAPSPFGGEPDVHEAPVRFIPTASKEVASD